MTRIDANALLVAPKETETEQSEDRPLVTAHRLFDGDRTMLARANRQALVLATGWGEHPMATGRLPGICYAE